MLSLYSEHPTWLHRWPAGAKLLALAVVGTALFAVQQWAWLLLATCISSSVLLSLGPAAQRSWTVLKPIAVACLLLVLLQTLLGNALVGVNSALRLICTASLGTALTLTTRYSDMLRLLERLLRPLGRLGLRHDLVALQMALMLRFTEHFFVQWQRMDDAHRVRTGRAGGWRLLAPFAIHILRTARQVADALRVRSGP